MSNNDNDFGFSLVDEKEPIVDRSQEIYDLIMPLMMNLSKDENKDVIKWPGKQRVKQITEMIVKINNIMGVGVQQKNG